MTARNDTDTDSRTRITLEVLALRAKTYAYSLVQFTGWAVLFYGVHQLAHPFLLLRGYDISLPEAVATVLPALSYIDALAAMFAGIIIVWISTASWF